MSSSTFRTCPDGHRCENGSSCAQHPLEEGTYYCDCETSPGDFAGLYCEYEAETYCLLQQETTSDWFCSNQGTCVLSTTGGGGGSGGDAAQWTCDCPTDFDGPVSFIFIYKVVWSKRKLQFEIFLQNIFVCCHFSFCFGIISYLSRLYTTQYHFYYYYYHHHPHVHVRSVHDSIIYY